MLNSESGQVVISSKINIFLCLFLRKCKFKMYDFNVVCVLHENITFYTAGKANKTDFYTSFCNYSSALKWKRIEQN